ncbi:GNAT family N-acetyltransferase [Neokomagataea thailandica]|uniref:Acetyltransferase n=1 Tax=Neokomagataea tanensis NBRC 106556 TaxID=1223519 RepID=A0ABQ0QGL3_9PROT|nr:MULTISPECIES: GNAT family N-acetyltransferase [Neokomagataea]GBR44128.1 acetyltransferase [Neokomagataea tanensis NBRC 106556]
MSVSVTLRDITVDDCLPLRQQVLWPNLTQDECRVEHDETAVHLGAFDGDTLVGCTSLFVLPDGEMQLRKFAVSQEYQGQGIGSALLRASFERCAALGLKTFMLSARVSAIGFYEKHGLTAVGDVYFKGPIPHRKMVCVVG